MSTIFCFYFLLWTFSPSSPHCRKGHPLCLVGKGQEAGERCPPQVTAWSFNGLSTLSSHLTEKNTD